MSGTTVCLLRSTDTGAPSLTGVAGSLVAVLDACLQDGYNSKTIQSITRSGATATVTYATAHNYAADGLAKVLISGCDQTEYNGIKQISNVSTNAFDFTVAGTPASGTGTMVSKVAPLGWSKTFSGTNKAVYRGNESTGTGLYLRVRDDNPSADSAKTAWMRGYETMTDVDTGTGLFPTVAQTADGVYLMKNNVDTGARPWVLVGDGFEFHLFYAFHGTTYAGIYRQFHFGDPCSEMAADTYGCLIYGDTAVAGSIAPETSQTTHTILATGISYQSGHYFARTYTQIGSSVPAGKMGAYSIGGSTLGSTTAPLAYPAPHNNGLYVAPLFVSDSSVIRAQLKGLYQPLQNRPLGNNGVLAANVSPIGRRLYAVATAYSAATPGETHLDIDGPWR